MRNLFKRRAPGALIGCLAGIAALFLPFAVWADDEDARSTFP